MAAAVGRADATRILLPINKCDNLVAGIGDITMTAIIEDAIEKGIVSAKYTLMRKLKFIYRSI